MEPTLEHRPSPRLQQLGVGIMIGLVLGLSTWGWLEWSSYRRADALNRALGQLAWRLAGEYRSSPDDHVPQASYGFREIAQAELRAHLLAARAADDGLTEESLCRKAVFVTKSGYSLSDETLSFYFACFVSRLDSGTEVPPLLNMMLTEIENDTLDAKRHARTLAELDRIMSERRVPSSSASPHK